MGEKEDKQEIALITNGCSTKLTSMVAHQVVDDHSKVPETEIDTINSETIMSGEKQAEIIEANVVGIKVEESTPQIVCDKDKEDGESKEKCDQDTTDDTQQEYVKDCDRDTDKSLGITQQKSQDISESLSSPTKSSSTEEGITPSQSKDEDMSSQAEFFKQKS